MQADIEARLWHIVSEHADLAECLPRLHAEFERSFSCKFVLIRKVETNPPRLMTMAAAGTNAFHRVVQPACPASTVTVCASGDVTTAGRRTD